jgi:hypothetical protein
LTINAVKSFFWTHEGTGDTRVKTATQYEGATAFPRRGTVLPWHVGEACEMLAPFSYQESAEKRKPPGKTRLKETLALGFNSSNSIWQCKIYHRKRGSAGLSMLFKSLWDIHRCIHFTVRSSNHSGE